ncbi:MAG: hypothetical protein WCR21_07395 [Bacteroidota bacterium]
MKSFSSFCFMIILGILSGPLQAQITAEFFGTKEDFKNLSHRILIVETLVENQNVISHLNKKSNHIKLVEEYKNFIKKYNEYIQITAYKYWKFNDSIEFRSEVEVAQLKKTRSHLYALLSYVELRDQEGESNVESIYSIPAIKYTRLETPIDKPDYKIYIPSSYIRKDNKYIEADFRVAVMAMQENIKYVMKHNENIEFQEFILDMADKNCKKLKKSTVLVENDMLAKEMSESKVKSNCKAKVEFVTVEEIDQHMFYKTKGKSAVIAFPLAILQGKGSNGPITSVVYFKIAVDCETGNIIWTNGGSLGHVTYDNNHSHWMTERDFKHMEPCD